MASVAQASSLGQIQWYTLQENQLTRAISDNNEEIIRLTRFISDVTTDITYTEDQIDDCEAKLESGCDCGEAACQVFDDIRAMMRDLELKVDDLEIQKDRAEQREAELQLENNEYQVKLDYIQTQKQTSSDWIKNANYVSRT